MEIDEIQKRLRAFARERDWEQFHSPKNLVMALAGEVGELVEIFQWLTEKQSSTLSVQDRARVEEELADVQIYLLRIFDVLDVDVAAAVERKIKINSEKYSIEEAKGNSTKYNRR